MIRSEICCLLETANVIRDVSNVWSYTRIFSDIFLGMRCGDIFRRCTQMHWLLFFIRSSLISNPLLSENSENLDTMLAFFYPHTVVVYLYSLNRESVFVCNMFIAETNKRQ